MASFRFPPSWLTGNVGYINVYIGIGPMTGGVLKTSLPTGGQALHFIQHKMEIPKNEGF